MTLDNRHIHQYNYADVYGQSPQERKKQFFLEFDAVMELLTERKFMVREQERRLVNKVLSNDPREKWFKTPPSLNAYPRIVLMSEKMLEEELNKIEEELGKYSCLE